LEIYVDGVVTEHERRRRTSVISLIKRSLAIANAARTTTSIRDAAACGVEHFIALENVGRDTFGWDRSVCQLERQTSVDIVIRIAIAAPFGQL